MTNDCLEALVALRILWLPKLDSSISTSRNQNIQSVNRNVNQFTDLTFVRLG